MKRLSATIPANEARTNFYQILDEVGEKLRQFIVTHRGKMQAVIMSAEEFAGWQETLEMMADKKLKEEIKTGLREIKAGKGINEEKAKRILGW